MARARKTKLPDAVDELFEEDPCIDLPDRPSAGLPPRLLRDRAGGRRPRPAQPRATVPDPSKDLREQGDPARVARATPPETPAVPEKPTPPEIPPQNPADGAARHQLAAFVSELDATRQRLREGVERSLNAYLATQSPKSLQAKNQVTAVIAGMLGRLGMAIEHDGQPCSFYTLSGTKDKNGRFRLVPHGTSRYVALSPRLEDFLPLRLMDAAPAIDLTAPSASTPPAAGRWQERVGTPAAEVERQ